MITLNMNTINLLEDEDKQKVSYLANLLLKKKKYKYLKKDLLERRNEIGCNDTLSHDEVWDSLNV